MTAMKIIISLRCNHSIHLSWSVEEKDARISESLSLKETMELFSNKLCIHNLIIGYNVVRFN